LARDLRVIAGHGYRVLSLQPVDMFPHTAHVETVAVLQQQRAASPQPPRRKPRSVA
jgi:23S rRNA (uracil1939-C5)-methyltransferase